MRFLIVVTIIFPIICRGEVRSGIIIYNASDRIVYAQSYSETESKIKFVPCKGGPEEVDKSKASVFRKSNICAQVSTGLQVEIIKRLLEEKGRNGPIIVTTPSELQKSWIVEGLGGSKTPDKRIIFRPGKVFDVLAKPTDPPGPPRSIIPSNVESLVTSEKVHP